MKTARHSSVIFSPTNLRNWIGYRPKYDSKKAPTSAGKGLCGNPYLVGTVSSALNTLVHDTAAQNKTYRLPGLFQTFGGNSYDGWGEYDDAIVFDANNNPVDIGAYIHVVGECAFLTNGLGTYAGNIANVVAGFASKLDPKSALTNKALPNVSQIYQITLAQLNELTAAKVNMLKFKGAGNPPALLHDYTAARNESDFIFKVRMDIKALVASILFSEADRFIGETMLVSKGVFSGDRIYLKLNPFMGTL